LNIYESDKLLAEYLLFHYGSGAEIAPPPGGERALDYAVRCVSECVTPPLQTKARALDLGCAVGRSTFELARWCEEVVGIDYSRRFIEAASVLQRDRVYDYLRTDEGLLATPLRAAVPAEIDRTRVAFEVGDAMALREGLGEFDVVLMANLIDRLSDPHRCLVALPGLVKPGGQLVITSPYTWLEEFTVRERWLGGYEREGMRVPTLAGLRETLEGSFTLTGVRDLPFLIREHARKFQLSIAQASLWRRNDDGH
jgi:putative 4-mercaptohistidine N1-methyltranferase